MPKYLWTAKHTFKSENDLNSHLELDEINFRKIAPQLRKAGMISAKRGILTEKERRFAHMGFLLFKSKKAYDICMAIIDKANWDRKIEKENRYETLIIDAEID